MTTPSDGEPVPPEAEPDFDPYRFGAPDVPPPPEFAPPGYKYPPGYQPPAPPAGGPPSSGPTPYPGPPPAPAPPPWGAPGRPGPSPYDAAPWQQQPASRGGSSGKALASMILGILSIVLCWLSLLDGVVVVLAVVFGFLGLADVRARGIAGRGQAIAGLVCAAVGAVLAIIVTILVVHAANQCGGLSHQNDPGFRQCVQDHFP